MEMNLRVWKRILMGFWGFCSFANDMMLDKTGVLVSVETIYESLSSKHEMLHRIFSFVEQMYVVSAIHSTLVISILAADICLSFFQ